MWKWDANGGCVDAGERVYPRLLAAAADKTDRRIIKRLLQRIFGENLHLEIVANWDEAVDAVRSGCHDIYLVDQFLGAGTGSARGQTIMQGASHCDFRYSVSGDGEASKSR